MHDNTFDDSSRLKTPLFSKIFIYPITRCSACCYWILFTFISSNCVLSSTVLSILISFVLFVNCCNASQIFDDSRNPNNPAFCAFVK